MRGEEAKQDPWHKLQGWGEAFLLWLLAGASPTGSPGMGTEPTAAQDDAGQSPQNF